MVPPRDDFLRNRIGVCGDCAAPLAHDQRYCIECGARRGELSDAIRILLGGLLHPDLAAATGSEETRAAAIGDSVVGEPEGPSTFGWLAPRGFVMPAPRVAAVAVTGILAFGVMLGSVVSPAAESAASAPVVVALASPPPTTPAPAPAPAPAPVDTSSNDSLVAPTPAPTAPPTQTVYTQAPQQTPSAPAPPKPLPVPPLPALPPVSHVFVVMLTGHGYDAAFGPNSQATYLSQTLVKDGELIPNYYAVTHGGLANEIALISGQGPNPETVNNCPDYKDVTPGDPPGDQGQAQGSGCVYPKDIQTVADQLFAGGNTWKAYIEDYAKGAAGCKPSDAYESWRNPFLYFHSLVDSPTCGSNLADLSQLSTDLQQVGDTPALSYIVPNHCHDGSETQCGDPSQPQPTGLAGADAWLQTVIPQIEASPGYKQGGLIAITFDATPKDGSEADSSSCCGQPDQWPNLPADDPSQQPSSSDQSAQSDQNAQSTPSSTIPTTDTGTSTAPAGTTTAPTPSGPPPVKSTGGGGKVGLLLISPYIKPNTVNTTGYYNHFSLFASIEDLFSLGHIAYANLPDLTTFDKTVYTAYQGGS